jgi:hypothetical protein
MNKKTLLILAFSLTTISCSSENSDGSDATTYSSCDITSSSAIFASDRELDVSQCWDGVNFEEKSLALSWCAELVNTYISDRYLIGHAVEYQVASTNCP